MERHRKANSTGLKVLITAGALTGSVALWSMFSSKAVETLKQNQAAQDAANQTAAVDQPAPLSTPYQPLPTATVPALRSVTIDMGNNQLVSKPAIQTIIVDTGSSAASTGSAGGSPSNSAPPPVTNTKTS
jgi:hypothetical protein